MGPSVFVTSDNYRSGVYILRPFVSLIGEPGKYHARAVEIRYTDGTSAESPLVDTIVVEVREIPKHPEHLPAFAVL
jgi:hypothetical protein